MLFNPTPQIALYVDPGSGALIWQTVMAVLVGGIFKFRSFFFTLFRRKK